MTTDEPDLRRLIRKNRISAWLYLAGAVGSILLTLLIVAFFMLIFGASSTIINGAAEGVSGGLLKPQNDDSTGFLFVSQQFWGLWLVCFLVVTVQLLTFFLMITKHSFGRVAGIVTFVLTALTFLPIIFIQLYGFVFLVGNQGSYFYNYLIKHNRSLQKFYE